MKYAPVRWRLFAGGFATLSLAALFAGCGGSSSSSPAVTPTAAPTAKGSASCNAGAAPASTTAPLTAGANTLVWPTVGGCSISVTVSGVTGTATQVTLTTSLTPPAGITLATPIAAAGQGGPPTGFSLPYTNVFYGTITFNGSFANGGNPTISYTVPTLTAGKNFFSVTWNGTTSPLAFQAYGSDCSGNALALSITGNTLTLPACPGTAGTPNSGATIVLSLAYF